MLRGAIQGSTSYRIEVALPYLAAADLANWIGSVGLSQGFSLITTGTYNGT